MAYQKTEWKDRKVQNPRTYSVRDNEDGTITLLEVPGEITEAGTPVNAENMNNIENGIATNETEIFKKKSVAYENIRSVDCSGSVTINLQDDDEIVSLKINDNATITIDTSQLTFPKCFYTVQFYVYFPNGLKTVSLSTNLSEGITYINGVTPDFSLANGHWLVARTASEWTQLTISDAGVTM